MHWRTVAILVSTVQSPIVSQKCQYRGTSKDVMTDTSFRENVRVLNWSKKKCLWRPCRIILVHLNGDSKSSPCISAFKSLLISLSVEVYRFHNDYPETYIVFRDVDIAGRMWVSVQESNLRYVRYTNWPVTNLCKKPCWSTLSTPRLNAFLRVPPATNVFRKRDKLLSYIVIFSKTSLAEIIRNLRTFSNYGKGR